MRQKLPFPTHGGDYVVAADNTLALVPAPAAEAPVAPPVPAQAEQAPAHAAAPKTTRKGKE